jgi:aldose 1-epimerase
MNRVFDAVRADGRSLALSLFLADGMDGFPGGCALSTVYTLNDENELIIDYEAAADAATIVNFCNHADFNLAGTAEDADILGHRLQLNARSYTPVDRELIPTGEIAAVAGTPFDFTTPRALGERIGGDHQQLAFGHGYDHNFVLDKGDSLDPSPPGPSLSGPAFAARLSEPVSGRVMEVWTTEPGIQLYTGNFLRGAQAGHIGKGGRPMLHRGALCLETQHFPDAIHHPGFPVTILNPGERYRSTTVFKFECLPRRFEAQAREGEAG